jgi:hypothetical protein
MTGRRRAPAGESLRIYVFRWRNNAKRNDLYGRQCKVVTRLKRNSAVVEFVDNGQLEVVSRNALVRADEWKPGVPHGRRTT